MTDNVEAGGFLTPSLPSPVPTEASTTSQNAGLPHPRSQPLRPGSAKESTVRQYVDKGILEVQTRLRNDVYRIAQLEHQRMARLMHRE